MNWYAKSIASWVAEPAAMRKDSHFWRRSAEFIRRNPPDPDSERYVQLVQEYILGPPASEGTSDEFSVVGAGRTLGCAEVERDGLARCALPSHLKDPPHQRKSYRTRGELSENDVLGHSHHCE